jgi:serine/threonine-protein kinase
MYGLKQGQKVAQFILEQQLGQGGQGSVWRAHADPDAQAAALGHIQGPIALKIIPVRGTPASLVERVRREAEALIRLSTVHPSVVACYGVFEDEPLGVLAVAMELVEGVDLENSLRDPRCDAGAREAILMHVARALGHLHDSGFVHRDVKPPNILVKHTFFGAQSDPSTVKLVDFGIATPKGNPKPLTEVGTVIGTPAYMPPERIDPMFWQGLPGSPTEDVFALGVVAYEAFFGRHPAGVEDDGTLSVYAERYRAIARTGEAWPQLPPGHRWTAALKGALALKREDRLADGNAVANLVGSGARTVSDPAIKVAPRTEMAMPIHGALHTNLGAETPPPGHTQVGQPQFLGTQAPAPGPNWATPAPVGVQAHASWPQAPDGGAPQGLSAVPPAPVIVHQRASSGGSNGALRALLAVVGVMAIGIPAAVMASRYHSSDDSGPITVPSTPDPVYSVPTTTDSSLPPTIPTIPTIPTTPGTPTTGGTHNNPISTHTGTSPTHSGSPIGSTVPTTSAGPITSGRPPHIGPGGTTTSPTGSTAGHPGLGIPIRIQIPGFGGLQPGGTQPGGTQPGGTQPGGSQPGGTQPGGTQPGGAGGGRGGLGIPIRIGTGKK